MWFLSSLQAGLWLKSVGLVRRSAAVHIGARGGMQFCRPKKSSDA